MTWRPIPGFTNPGPIHKVLEAVAEGLLDQVEQFEEPSLSVGLSGIALFFAYFDRAWPCSRYREASLTCLERAMTLMAMGRRPFSLFDGFCGLAWTIEHLGLADDDEDPLADVDEALIEWLDSPNPRVSSDLTHGLAGIGIYLIERLPRRRAREGLARLLARLEETAEQHGKFRTWRRLLATEESRHFFDLGVAHGVPGVLGFLAQLHWAGIEPVRTRRLAEDVVGWLLEQQLPENENCRFPAAVGPGIEPIPARTAWCSGDLGITSVLLLAGLSFDRRDWRDLALQWARLAARRPLKDIRAVDASLCHGTAGLGHLFLRIHRATGDRLVGEAASFWLERTLELRIPGTGLAGFSSWSGDKNGDDRWRGEPGFQTGAAGIGLVLLAAAGDVEPSWDRVLGLSQP